MAPCLTRSGSAAGSSFDPGGTGYSRYPTQHARPQTAANATHLRQNPRTSLNAIDKNKLQPSCQQLGGDE